MKTARATGGNRRLRRGRGDDGAALVEFALIAPVLFAIILGAIEFSYAYFQQLDVRHGAREGTRLAAVDFANGSTSALKTEICDRLDKPSGVDIGLSLDSTLVLPNSSSDVGDEVTITVRRELDTVTGFYDFMLGGKVLTSTVKTRLEQDTTYTADSATETLPGDDCP